MVNCIGQLGWATVPRYVGKHYFECFCEDVYWMRFTFKLVDSVKQIALHSVCG